MIELGELKDYGFKLVEPDDHVTQLFFKDKLLGVYNQNKVTAEIIERDCWNFIRNTVVRGNNEN